jgi:hypothetical protein
VCGVRIKVVVKQRWRRWYDSSIIIVFEINVMGILRACSDIFQGRVFLKFFDKGAGATLLSCSSPKEASSCSTIE